MRDPIDALENFDPGGSMNPLPAAEVRRLGDRHRRRRTTGIALAAAAAVAVVATGGAVIGDDRDARSIDPAGPTPTSLPTAASTTDPARTTALLDAIDITVGMPANDSGEPVAQTHLGRSLVVAELCGVDALADPGVADRVVAEATGPEYADKRELRVYPDAEAAAAAVEAVRRAVADCPSRAYGSTTWVHSSESLLLGEDATRVVRTYRDGDQVAAAAEWWQVVQVGNAVLAALVSGEYVPGITLEPAIAEHTSTLDPIVDQMCVFASSCSGETASSEAPSTEAPAGDVVPADFPLAAGFPTDSEPGPDYGLTGPAEDVEVLEGLEVCGTGLPAAAAIDRLAARWANPEDYRSRVLLAFEDADAAIAYQGAFLQTYRSCPRDPGSDGYVSVNDVRRTAVGGESWAVVRTFELQGSPAIGLEVLHVVRVGSAVLVDVTSAEGMAEGAEAQLTSQTEAAAEVVAAMCAFTEAGC